jgi:hypothetical protein
MCTISGITSLLTYKSEQTPLRKEIENLLAIRTLAGIAEDAGDLRFLTIFFTETLSI